MIPILYDSDEILFDSNGLGRLRDCVSCVVTEERNGIYECDFEYPVDGAHFDEIQLGRIIACTHDDTEDVQPFDIVSASKPINGIVTFHAVHISYRQSFITVAAENVNYLNWAFHVLKSSAIGENPFGYFTDMDSAGYVAAFDGIPKSVRALLGGTEGSLLDTYGGEFEWDKFRVNLWRARGTDADVTIRYGVNLIDYTDEIDYAETFSAVVPYWTGSDTKVIGDMVDTGLSTYNGRTSVVPLDLSDKFETAPTNAELASAARTYMATNQTYLPSQSISINFVKLEESSEYASLHKCKLCDTVRVIFPRYDVDGRYKIVRTEYDVLRERYTSMELGNLPTSLSDALGVSSGGSGSRAISSSAVDYVTATDTSSGWSYRKWDSGKIEAWRTITFDNVTFSAAANLYRSGALTGTLPSGLFTSAPILFTSIPSSDTIVSAVFSANSATDYTGKIFKLTQGSGAISVAVNFYAVQI